MAEEELRRRLEHEQRAEAEARARQEEQRQKQEQRARAQAAEQAAAERRAEELRTREAAVRVEQSRDLLVDRHDPVAREPEANYPTVGSPPSTSRSAPSSRPPSTAMIVGLLALLAMVIAFAIARC
jgi:hypothetical protein